MEMRGAYAFDPKTSRISLPPERTRDAQRRGKDADRKSSRTAALSSAEITSAMVGMSSPVDLDDTLSDVDTSFETVTMADSNEAESSFRDDVRNEWIDAMFGRDFFRDEARGEEWRDLSVKQGEGEAKVGKYVTYGALLDPNVHHSNNNSNGSSYNFNGGLKETPLKESISAKTKSTPLLLTNSLSNLSLSGSLLNEEGKPAKIGATISRIPLGVYVKSVAIDSEAYWVGIEPGSILVDVNGLGLLGETTFRALERLWRYSGDIEGNLAITKPTVVRLYKRRVYSVLLVGGSPLKGIEWGPCGNFGLVQRSNGMAAECGVRRGSLVLAVNGVGLRKLDHAGAARELLRNFDGGRGRVVVTCGYTPASSRSGYYEDRVEKKRDGGVEVRSRPVEYSTALTETIFACTAPSVGVVEKGEETLSSELAAYVAAGCVLPPGKLIDAASHLGISKQHRRRMAGNVSIGPCPAIDNLLKVWDPLTSLVRSMSYQAAGYCETSFVENGGPFRTLGETVHSWSECLVAIEEIASCGVAEQVFEAHLMQLLGVATYAMVEQETPSDNTNNNVLSEKLLDILVDVALNDITLCQCLFFLIRSFLGALEEKATLSAKLLRYAQRRLSGRMFDKSECHEADRHCSEGYPMSRENSSASSFRKFCLEVNVAEEGFAGKPANGRQPSGLSGQEAGGNILDLENAHSGESPSTDNLSCQTPANQSHTNTEDSTISTNNDGAKKLKKGNGIKKIQQLLKGGKSKNNAKKLSQDGHLPPKSKQGSSFSLTNVFHKQSSSLQSIGGCPSSISNPPAPAASLTVGMSLTMSQKFESLSWFLRRIDNTCAAIEKNLIKSFPQKMADLALFPFSASRESALTSVTQSFRTELRNINSDSRFPILNPIDSLEQLTSVDADECFILPSAHFPMLLCFNSRHSSGSPSSPVNSKVFTSQGGSFDTLYRTKVEVLGLRSTAPLSQKANGSGEAYVVQGSVSGVVHESGPSELYINPIRLSQREVISHQWTKNNVLLFESSSNWGFPQTLSLKISTISRNVDSRDDINVADDKGSDMGCGFVDLSPLWNQINQGNTSFSLSVTSSTRVYLFDNAKEFDQHGDVEGDFTANEQVEIQYRISVEVVPADVHPQKCLLLYKHGEDLRQELLAIQFIERCNQILKASGLDLKLKTFRCLPVGAQKGFIEWVSGTVPLSQLCESTGSSHPGSSSGSRQGSRCQDSMNLDESQHSAPASADVIDQTDGLEAQKRSWCKYQALRGLCQQSKGTIIENPIQDFLRSAGYDESAPYFVSKNVMDNYVKSCAGYCVVTYLLGVGDRHLDNILLHQNGHLLHCDYSFILGHDPKTYLPMRITEEMIQGLGGRESDNFSRFLSFTGAAFLTLRRHSNLHSLLSQIRDMTYSNMRDVSQTQQPEEAILAMRGRFRLDLSDDEALTYIEQVVEKSISSKMWRAVDVMHSLGKHL